MNTPIVTSGWRNPERNERVNGALNSNHQHGAAVDLVPGEELTNDAYPRIYLAAALGEPDAPSTWCELTASAYNAGNPRETLVENTRGARPAGVSAVYYYYDDAPNFNNCVTTVQDQIEACLSNFGQGPYTLSQRTSCSPNHTHTARN